MYDILSHKKLEKSNYALKSIKKTEKYEKSILILQAVAATVPFFVNFCFCSQIYLFTMVFFPQNYLVTWILLSQIYIGIIIHGALLALVNTLGG